MRLGYMTAASLLLAVPGAANAEWKIYAQESPGGPWQYKITKQDNQGRQATMRGCTGMRGNHASKGVNQATGEEYVVVCSQVNGTTRPATTSQPAPRTPSARAPSTGFVSGAKEWQSYHQKRAGGNWAAVGKPSANPRIGPLYCTANFDVKSVNTRTGEVRYAGCDKVNNGARPQTASNTPANPVNAALPSPKKQILDYAREIDKGGLLGRVLPQDE